MEKQNKISKEEPVIVEGENYGYTIYPDGSVDGWINGTFEGILNENFNGIIEGNICGTLKGSCEVYDGKAHIDGKVDFDLSNTTVNGTISTPEKYNIKKAIKNIYDKL